jgi:glycerophosphoryl diester phosphodiesterase
MSSQRRSVVVVAHRGWPPDFRKTRWPRSTTRYRADGHIVVLHDDTVDRTTNGLGRADEMTHAEITALDAGAGQRIPTYPEVLEALRDSGIQPGTTRPLSQPASTERETRQLIWRVLLSRGAPVCGLWNRPRVGWL